VTLVVRYGALSDIGLHRMTNEDAFVVAPPLFAVCDGMGGAQAGEVASALAAETLASAVAGGQTLLSAAHEANAAVFARASENIEQTGMGTTLTALQLEGETGRFVHIGDSRAYVLRDGGLEQLSDDHSLVGEMVREGRLSENEALVHPHRSILSRALGTEPEALIDEFEVDLLPGDVVLLCSDGLSGPVDAAAIKKALSRADPQDSAKKLIAEARKHGGPDNITALVVRLDEAPEEESAEGAAAADDITEVIPADEASTEVIPAGEASAAEETAAEAAARRRARRRLGRLAAVLSVVVLALLAGVLVLSSVFYIGVDDGRLAVYSGLPAKIGPVPLHAVYRRSAEEYSALSPLQRRLVDRRELGTRDSVMALAESLGMWP
jgi:serine/threonine protein phosphatase PrpC